MDLGQEENTILQSYLTVSLLAELCNNQFLKSDYYEKMVFGNPSLKPLLCQVGVDNQGCLLMMLYALLCIPKETIFDKYRAEFDKINAKIAQHAILDHTTYSSDKQGSINYVRHIRNAVAHVKVKFFEGKVQFADEGKNGKESFLADIPLSAIGDVLMELQKLIYKYVNDIKSASKTQDTETVLSDEA